MIAELGPLLEYLVQVGDEAAVWDDAADVKRVTLVPVDWPGYWISHFSFLFWTGIVGVRE